MVKDIAKCFLSLFAWMSFYAGLWIAATVFAAYMLNFGRPL